MSNDIIDRLVPGLLSAVRGIAVTREVLAMSLEQLGREIREGKHIPDSAVARASEDQKTLEGIFSD